MTITARVEWLAGSDKALAELGKKSTEKNVLIRTLKKAAQPIMEEAQAMAPIDTGKLQLSIITGTKLTRRQRSSAYKAGSLGVAEVHVGTALSRGLFQEFGTFDQPAQPFMRPAWENNKGAALQVIGTELWVEIRKAADRAARKAAKAV